MWVVCLIALFFFFLGGGDVQGGTPMHTAATSGALKAIRVLVEVGGDLEAKDVSGINCSCFLLQTI